MKRYLFLLILILTICGCKNVQEQKQNTDATYVISIPVEDSKSLEWLNKLKVIKQVPLETNGFSLISHIEKIYITDHSIIIYDNRLEDIFIFDLQGNYKAKCGTHGTGPGEHIRFNDVFYEKDTQLIYAHDAVRRFMQIFDLKGNLLEEFLTENFWFQSFCKIGNSYWIHTGYKELNPKGYSLMRVDDRFENLLAGYFPQKEFFPRRLITTFFENEKGDHFYFSPYGNTAFRLNDAAQLTPEYEIDFGSKTLPYQKIILTSDNSEYSRMLSEKEYMGDMSTFISCGDNFLFTYREMQTKSDVYFAWYDKKKKKALSYNSFVNSGGNVSLVYPIGMHKEGLIFMLLPHDLNEEQIDDLERQYNCKLDFDSNPILIYTTNPAL